MNPIYQKIILFVCLGLLAAPTWAQTELKFGIRAGVNLANMSGPSETDDAGAKLESNQLKARIVAGLTMRAAFTERLGLLAELNFSQKGNYHRYEGLSYMQFPDPVNQTFTGHKRIMAINVVNGYVEVPVNFYYELIDDKFTVEIGAAAGLLVSSRGLGTLKYIDDSHPANIVEYGLDHRYLQDEALEVKDSTVRTGIIDGIGIEHPASIGAYYSNSSKSGSYFNRLDLSANFGFSYNLTEGLRLGARAQYSLLDITNNYYDVSYYKLGSNNQPSPRKDIDRNIGLQLYLGLQF